MIDDLKLREALKKAENADEFEDNAWLTFYLEGETGRLESLAGDLAQLGAQNLDGTEGGFLYAKLPTKLLADEIESTVSKVHALAVQHAINVGLIDLDSSQDVQSSTFFTVYQER